MSNETAITVVGNLTDDPELKFTPSGAAVANFTIAAKPRTYDRQANEWKDGDSMFFRCAAWRQLAENVAESLTKGTRVIVTGNLRIREYERTDGSKGTSVEIQVEEIGPSLKWATTKITKAGGGSRPAQADPWGAQPTAEPTGGASWGGQQTEAPF